MNYYVAINWKRSFEIQFTNINLKQEMEMIQVLPLSLAL